MNNFYIALLLTAMAATLYALYRRDTSQARNSRASVFDDCAMLLTNAAATQHAIGFPRLKGSYHGYQVMLEVQVDTLSMRKLPPLWLMVTVVGHERTQGSLDVLVRPQNTEFYSPAWQWSDTLANPPGWPQHAIVRHQGEVAALDVLDDFVPPLFNDEKVKELLVTPDLVRITYMAKQAERGQYLLMRNAIFDGLPIDRASVDALLQAATDLRQKLEGVRNEC